MLRNFVMSALIAGLPLAVPPGNTLKGIVRDAQDYPVAGAWLEARSVPHAALTPADFEAESSQWMRTGEDGRWEFTDLGAGVWIVTAVASTEPRTDAEFRELARPRADGATPAGVAITRLIRHVEGDGRRRRALHGLGLAAGSTATSPLRGRLTGAFAPDKYGYEVQVKIRDAKHSGPGMHVFTFSSNSENLADTPNIFSAVPDAEGKFDFGALEVTDYDSIDVVRFPLDSYDESLEGTAYRGWFLQFKDRKDSFDVPLQALHVVTLRAMAADGVTAADASVGKITFNLWDEKGGEVNAEEWEASRRQMLPAGTYLASATQGRQASPLIAFTLGGDDAPAEFPLALQPCNSFTVRFVDQHGVPLQGDFVELGIEASAGFPDPCRVTLLCQGGVARIRDLFPGRYLVEITDADKPAFTVSLDLQPGDEPVVVTVP